MSESMDYGDYPRDRSRSPARNNYYDNAPRDDRSMSPPRGRDTGNGYRGRDGGFRGGRGGRGGRDYQSSFRPRNDYRGGDRGGSFRDSYRPHANYETRASNRKYENSVFVGNLPYNCQWWELKDHFAAAGSVVRADIVTSRGRSRGMGTVEYDSYDAAQRAIHMFNRTPFKDREIFVREDLPPPDKAPTERGRYEDNGYDRYGGYDRYDGRGGDSYAPPRRDNFRRENRGIEVFVGNLPFSVRWQDLKDLFKPYGDVERADVLETPTGRSRGMGTVYFHRQEDADDAIEKLNGYEWEGRVIDVRLGKFQKPQSVTDHPVKVMKSDGLMKNTDFTLGVTGDGPESDTLYVANLPWETAESDLFELFGSVATVERAELQYGRGGMSSGNAVVKFASVETARAVIQQLNNYEYGGRNLKISFALFPSPEKLEALHEEIRKSTEQNNSEFQGYEQNTSLPTSADHESKLLPENEVVQQQTVSEPTQEYSGYAEVLSEPVGTTQGAEPHDDVEDMIEE